MGHWGSSGASGEPDNAVLQTAISATLIVYGVIAMVCALLTKRYALEEGGPMVWWLGLTFSVGHVAVGLLRVVARRWRGFAAYCVVVLVFASLFFSAVHATKHTSHVLAAAFLADLVFLLILVGSPGLLRASLGFAALSVIASLLLRSTWRELSFPPLSGPPVKMEIMLVDESACALGGIELPASAEVTLHTENIGNRTCRFVRFHGAAGANFAETRRRADAWAARVTVREGSRIAWESEVEKSGIVLRSYVIRVPAVLTADDVEDASVDDTRDMAKPSVTVSFKSEAAKRLQEITREHRGERLAVLFDGSVQLAATIRAEVSAGRMQISPGHEKLDNAKALALGLKGELLHGPAAVVSDQR